LFIEQSRAKALAVRGTLEAWKARVAAKALLSTSLTVMMAASCAAPLLRASGLQNFSLHLAGPTRVGKTTELIAAMSFYGFGTAVSCFARLTSARSARARLRYST
jgi:uncharacterized protein (DUF927 family)